MPQQTVPALYILKLVILEHACSVHTHLLYTCIYIHVCVLINFSFFVCLCAAILSSASRCAED